MLQTVRMTMLAAVLAIPLASCQTTGTSGNEAVCAQWRGIYWSAKDTPETIGEVKASNARRKAWCNG